MTPPRNYSIGLPRCTALLVCFQILYAGVALADERLKTPSTSEQEKARELVHKLFRDDYASKKPEARSALAHKLLDKASDERSDMVARFVLLKEAHVLAVAAQDTATALRAVDELEKRFRVDSLALRREALKAAPDSKLSLVEKDRLASAWIRLLEKAIEEDDYESGQAIGKDALLVAKKLRDTKITEDIKSTIARLKRIGEAYEKLRPHVEVLLDEPENPEAHFGIGSFYLFEKGDVSEGLAFIAKGPPSPLQEAAEIDLSTKKDPAEQIEAGEFWHDLIKDAGEKHWAVFLKRAAFWYRRALPSLSGLVKLKAERRLAELKDGEEEELEQLSLEDFATLCFSKTRRRWSVSPLDEFAIARKNDTRIVKNVHAALQFAYLICKSPMYGDFTAELEINGALAVGIVSEKTSTYTYTVEAPLRSGSHKVRIVRAGEELEFWIDKRKIEPKRGRRTSLTKNGYLFVQIGKNKTCYVSRFAVHRSEPAGKRDSRRQRR